MRGRLRVQLIVVIVHIDQLLLMLGFNIFVILIMIELDVVENAVKE